MPQNQQLIDKLAGRLPTAGARLLEAVRVAAEPAGLRAFAVGGTVRDLLLDRESLDVDITIEGDAVALAREIATRTRVKIAKTTAFGTATLKAEGFTLDLATARAETYPRPGALPRVHPSTIDADLLRRDFTINALALQLTSPAPGKLLDPVGGVSDLRAASVRVLHDRSFQDDATRILRAVRYEARFGFHLEERTLDLLRRDLSYLDTISGTRLRQELARTLAEQKPEHALARLQELDVLAALHPSLSFGARQRHALLRLREMGSPALAVWALLAWDAPAEQIRSLSLRLSLTRAQAAIAESIPATREASQRLADKMRPSEVRRLLDPLPLPGVHALAAMAAAQTARDQAMTYLTTWRTLRPILRGDDLIQLSVLPGPDVGDVLALLRAAKLDGELKSRADEVRFVEEFLARERIGLA